MGQCSCAEGMARTKKTVGADSAHQGTAECIKENAQRATAPLSSPWDGPAAVGTISEAMVELKRLVLAADILNNRIKGLRKSYYKIEKLWLLTRESSAAEPQSELYTHSNCTILYPSKSNSLEERSKTTIDLTLRSIASYIKQTSSTWSSDIATYLR